MNVASVLLLGNYRPTLTLARSLAPLGYRVIVGLYGGEGGAQYSRFAHETWDHPPLEGDADDFCAALRTYLARRPDIRFVLPVTEDFVQRALDFADRLPPSCTLAMPSAAVVRTLLDKLRAYEEALAAGVPVAPFATASDLDELRSICAEIGYPLVLRPLGAASCLFSRKALIVESAAELASRCPAWPEGHAALLVQRYVTGPRHNVYFAAQKGRLVRSLEVVVERTDSRDGTGLAVEGCTVALSPDLELFTSALAASLCYTGVGCAQFLVDRPAGHVYFLEVNPRIAGNHAIAEAAGLELGRLSIELAANSRDIASFKGQAGLRFAWTYGDLRGVTTQFAAGRIGLAEALKGLALCGRAAILANIHMTWRWDDPVPTAMLFAEQIPVMRALLRNGRGRRAAARRGKLVLA